MQGSRHSRFVGRLWRMFVAVAVIWASLPMVIAIAAGGDYSIDFSAARPGTYERAFPSQLAPPGGRATDPLPGASHAANVESLAPQQLALGQIVPFEVLLSATAGAPPGDSVTFTATWGTQTTNGGGFGYDPAYGVYAAFVDPGDASSSGGDTDAAVSNVTWSASGGKITGSITVSQLDPGEHVVVEVWVVLQDEIPAGTTGNVQSRLESAVTAGPTEGGDTISTGSQTVPLLKVKDFLGRTVDLVVSKTDPGTGTKHLEQFAYTVTVANTSADVVANGVTLVDTLDPNTTLIDIAVLDTGGAASTCAPVAGGFECDLQFLEPGEIVTITATVETASSAPFAASVEDGTCTGNGDADLCNLVSIAALNLSSGSTTSASEPTDVFAPIAFSVVKTASPSSIPEPGQPVTFSVDVVNDGPGAFTLASLFDSVYGDLSGVGTCSVPQQIDAGGTYSCAFTAAVEGIPGTVHTNVVTAEASSGESAQDAASVTIENVEPAIEVTKTVFPAAVTEPGGTVTFDVEVFNASGIGDPVTIESLVDDVHGDLDGLGSCAVPQTIEPGGSYACSFEVFVGGNAGFTETDTVTATGTDDEGSPIADSDQATVTVENAAPSVEVAKTANPAVVPEPGASVIFDVVVTNTSGPLDPVTIESLVDDVHGDLDGVGSCAVPQTIEPGGSYACSFEVFVGGNAGFTETDTVTATGTDDDGAAVSGSDSATVTVSDVGSAIQVVKEATPSVVPEPGGTVTFGVTVNNLAPTDAVTIESLVDDVHGDLDGLGSCAVPQTIEPGGSYACSFEVFVGGNAGFTETDTVTATGTDDDGAAVSGSDSATVTVSDAPPVISVTKTPNPPTVDEPGQTVTFTVAVTNLSGPADPVTLQSLIDDVHGDLNGRGTCLANQVIPPGGTYECSYAALVAGNAGFSETSTVTASGIDDDGAPASASGAATVTVVGQAPRITVEKTPSRTEVDEPGDTISFSVRVTNRSAAGDPVTITSLVDDVHGDLDGRGNCAVPFVIQPGNSYSCIFSAYVAGNAGDTETDVVTATGFDDEGEPVTAFDDATVSVVNADPSILVLKIASPDEILEPGRLVRFFVDITNLSVATDPITVTSITDDVFADIDGKGTCSLPRTIESGGVYTCYFDAQIDGNAGFVHRNVITVAGTDDEGVPVTGQASATVEVLGAEPSITVTKSAVPASVPEPGGSVIFNVTVANTSFITDTVTITSLVDDVHGNLDGRGSCSVPQAIEAGESYQCSFSAFVFGDAGDTETDTITAVGADDEGTPVEGSASAVVTVTDVAPSVSLQKSASPTTLPEPGGEVQFSVVVSNDSPVDSITVTSLVDDVHGDLNGMGTCAVPQTIDPGATYECSFGAFVAGNAGGGEIDVVTASGQDSDGAPFAASDFALVTIVDAAPVVTIAKSADPSQLDEPGGSVIFDVTITNSSASSDPVVIDTIEDDVHGDLDGRGTCAVPVELLAGETYQCAFSAFVGGNAGFSETDVITVTGSDDDGTPFSVSDSATVEILDVAPVIVVEKSAAVAEVTEPGALVTFTVTVTNGSAESDPVTITSMIDSIYGDVLASRFASPVDSTCQPVTLAPGATYECSFTGLVSGGALDVHYNDLVVTVVDDDGTPGSGSDYELIDVTDVPSALAVVKTPSVTTVPASGADVTFTVTATNESEVDSVTVTSVVDDLFGDVSDSCVPPLPAELAPGDQVVCSFTRFVDGLAGEPHRNTVTVEATDDDGNELSGSDQAEVAFSPVIDLELELVASDTALLVDDTSVLTLTLRNNGPSRATGVAVTHVLPSALGYLGHAGAGLYEPSTGAWIVGNLDAGAVVQLTVTVVGVDVGSFTTDAEVTAAVEPDIDSVPGDGQGDDFASATIGVAEIRASGTIGDTVFLDLDQDGIEDADEPGIAGVTVTLTNTGSGEVMVTSTNSDGKYLFAALVAGAYRVDVTRPSSTVTATTPERFSVTLTDGGSFLDADFGFAESLPRTGIEVAHLALVGLLLLACGVVLLGAGRRSRDGGRRAS